MKTKLQKTLLLLVMMAVAIIGNGQYLLPEYIEHVDNTKPLIFVDQLNGSYWQVDSLDDRDSIPTLKREIGMMVTYATVSDFVTARYEGADVTNINWENADNWSEFNDGVFLWQKINNKVSLIDADTIEIKVNDQIKFIVNSDEVARCIEDLSYKQFIISPDVVQNDGSHPSLAFGDGNTGFYEGGDDNLVITLDGTPKWFFTTNYFAAISSSYLVLVLEMATATNPVFRPNQTDNNTGIGRAGDDQLSLISGGVEGIRITENTGDVDVEVKGDLEVVNNIGIGAAPALSRLKVVDNNMSGSSVLEIHTDDEVPWLATFYNDTYSSSNPVFQYFGFNSGNFSMGTYDYKDIGLFIGISNYDLPILKLDASNLGIYIRNSLELEDTLFFYNRASAHAYQFLDTSDNNTFNIYSYRNIKLDADTTEITGVTNLSSISEDANPDSVITLASGLTYRSPVISSEDMTGNIGTTTGLDTIRVSYIYMNGSMTVKATINLVDDAIYSLPAKNLFGRITCTTTFSYSDFNCSSAGVSVINDNTGDVDNADTDGKVICIYDAGANAVIKNRSGGSLSYTLTYTYDE